MEEPAQTSMEMRDARQAQHNLIATSCNLIIGTDTIEPFKSFEDAAKKLGAYHVCSLAPHGHQYPLMLPSHLQRTACPAPPVCRSLPALTQRRLMSRRQPMEVVRVSS